MQAALQIANAASTNAYDDQYPSPYTVEALRQGMDLPWWQKLLGARFKDGKFQLARLQVCTTSSHVAYVACRVLVYEAHLCSLHGVFHLVISQQRAKPVVPASCNCNLFLQQNTQMGEFSIFQFCWVGQPGIGGNVHLEFASAWHDKVSWLELGLACSGFCSGYCAHWRSMSDARLPKELLRAMVIVGHCLEACFPVYL